uniref:Uncharacterized protein n=3 Tax=Aegilops tauschii subsp. strangulata TaxID=200361 RepID=A0A453T290_AEGTS
KKKKHDHTISTSSPPPSLAHEALAAAATHAGRFRRAPPPRSTPSSSPWSTQPSPLSIFSAPGLCRPLATPPPAARVSGRASPARLRRPQGYSCSFRRRLWIMS